MIQPRRRPAEEDELKYDLLETMLVKEYHGPNSVPIDTVLDWFAEPNQDFAIELIESMHEDYDCPLKYDIRDHDKVWLRDREETQEYMETLLEEADWP